MSCFCSECDAQVRVLEDRRLGRLCSVCSASIAAVTTPGATRLSSLFSLRLPSATGPVEVTVSEEMLRGGGVQGDPLGVDEAYSDLLELFGEDFRELLRLSSGNASNKTISVSFLETLGKVKLDERKALLYDLTLQIGPLKLFAVPASFTSLPFDAATAQLVACAESVHGNRSDLLLLRANSNDYYRGKIVCLRRGDSTFAEKLLFAQALGAAGCVVFNTYDVFPFVMMDSKAELGGSCSSIPIFMVSKEDSLVVERLLEEKRPGGIAASLVCSGIPELCCSICQEPMAEGEEVLKLPCRHCYHSECVHTWLHKNNSCPMCRRQLPAATTKEVASRRERANPANQPYFI